MEGEGAVLVGSSMRNQRKLFTSPIRAGNSTEVEARVGWNFRDSVLHFPPPPRVSCLYLGGREEGTRGRGRASFLSLPSSPSRVSPAAGRKLYRGSNDASPGNGEGSSRPEVRHIRARARAHTGAYTGELPRVSVTDVGSRISERDPVAHK